ncbi:hypothetical protein D1007_46252 [Hordeum vulgare]|nr:hypothetical protein D1007_46252 [Hordeum vulgare]
MWSYKPSDPWVVQEFYHTTHENLWRILLKPQQEWPAEDEDTGLDAETPLWRIGWPWPITLTAQLPCSRNLGHLY